MSPGEATTEGKRERQHLEARGKRGACNITYQRRRRRWPRERQPKSRRESSPQGALYRRRERVWGCIIMWSVRLSTERVPCRCRLARYYTRLVEEATMSLGGGNLGKAKRLAGSNPLASMGQVSVRTKPRLCLNLNRARARVPHFLHLRPFAHMLVSLWAATEHQRK